MFEIFPWSPHLETGIALIDEQHRKLVGLLNRLAQQHVEGATEAEIQTILGELADYADYHFRTEEGIWQTALAGDSWLDEHIRSHQRFFTHIVELRAGHRPFQEVLDDLFSFLIQWLAYHILDNDKRMAMAVLAVQEGLRVEAARQRADAQMLGATATLIQTVLAMYQTLSSQALALMREKLARQSAEKALREGEARWHFLLNHPDPARNAGSPLERHLSILIDHLPAGLVVVDAPTQRFVFANPWFCQMLGYTRDELLTLGPANIHPPEILPSVHADLQSLKVDQKKASVEIPVVRKDGSRFMANVERVPIELDGQTSVMAIFTDVTERLAAEQALQTSESHLHTLVNTIPDLIWLKDVNGVYLSCNPAFERFFGAPEATIVGKTDHDFVPRELADFFREKDRAAMAAQRPTANEEWVTFASDGHRALLETTKVPLNGPDGAVMGVLGISHDITDQHKLQQALQETALFMRETQSIARVAGWKLNPETGYLKWTEELFRMVEHPSGEAPVLETGIHYFAPEDQPKVQHAFKQAWQDRQPFVHECRMISRSGHAFWAELRCVGRLDQPDGSFLVGTFQDITQRQADALALETERLRLQNAIDAAQAGTWEWDIASGMVRFSERLTSMLGYDTQGTQESSYDTYLARIHPDDRPQEQQRMARHLNGELPRFEVEMRMHHQDGHWVWCRSLGRVMLRSAQGEPLRVAGISIDISEQKTHREQIDYITHHDALTGLPNRNTFVELLTLAMAACTPLQTHLAVAYLDLDGFAAINETHGREVGSLLIIEVSKRLVQAMREHHHLAHIGGDEFAVILSHLEKPETHIAPVQRLLAAVSRPLQLAGLNLTVTASIGITLYPQSDRVDAEQLLRQADQAMYLAKLAGKNRYHLFDPVNDETTRHRFLRIDEIRQALVKGEFVLHYQPKIHLRSGEVIGFEALIRWQHPQRGLLPPGAFIPLLDRHPMAITLGDWVIEAALAQLAQWQTKGMETAVSVNIDSLQLHDPDFADRLQRQLQAQPSVLPGQLELEILETGALENLPRVSALIARLQAMGIECALDDFGTGYSSLTFLKQLGAHTIKIDQSFVRGILDDTEHAAIVNSVLSLANNFDRRSLAEGVETEALGRALIEFGCEFGQGYAIARPMPAAAVPRWLSQWHPPQSWTHTHAVAIQDITALLAEVEHRAWLKHLHAFVLRHATEPPAHDSRSCRFGQWLARPSTRRRFAQHPDFVVLEMTHDTLHQRTHQLVARLRADDRADVSAELAALDTLSEEVLGELRKLRQTEPDSQWADSLFG